jgi:hypothetical protein
VFFSERLFNIILQQILHLPVERVEAVFEKVFTKGFYEGENTNFDFYLESSNCPRAFFELKHTSASSRAFPDLRIAVR